MSSAATPPTVELRDLTQRLRSLLDILETPSSPPVLASQQIAELLSALMRAGECMRGMPEVRDDGGLRTVSAYRAQVERLRALLPSIHGALLQERARLAREQERLRSVTAWTQASQQTL